MSLYFVQNGSEFLGTQLMAFNPFFEGEQVLLLGFVAIGDGSRDD